MLYDKDFAQNPNPAVRQLVIEGLRYLDSRIEFWRQQKPLYARKKEIIRIKVRKDAGIPVSPKKAEA